MDARNTKGAPHQSSLLILLSGCYRISRVSFLARPFLLRATSVIEIMRIIKGKMSLLSFFCTPLSTCVEAIFSKAEDSQDDSARDAVEAFSN